VRPEQIELVDSATRLARVLSSYDRRTVEAFAEVCIAVLDRMDPDPDLENDDPREDDEFAARVPFIDDAFSQR
jgi:hypothetical protein